MKNLIKTLLSKNQNEDAIEYIGNGTWVYTHELGIVKVLEPITLLDGTINDRVAWVFVPDFNYQTLITIEQVVETLPFWTEA